MLWNNTARVPNVTHGNVLDSGYTKRKVPSLCMRTWKEDNESLSNFFDNSLMTADASLLSMKSNASPDAHSLFTA